MSLDGEWISKSEDHFWSYGCCKVCSFPEKKAGCWCERVKCQECLWYEGKTIENEDYDNLTHLKGKCIFPSSTFGFPSGHLEIIIKETIKAILIKYNDYPSFWIPKSLCIIEKEDGFEYVKIKGSFLIMKANEYENKDNKSKTDELLAEIYYDISQEYMG